METNGLNSFTKNQICGIGLGTLEGKTYYFPFLHHQGGNLTPNFKTDLKLAIRGYAKKKRFFRHISSILKDTKWFAPRPLLLDLEIV